VDERLPGGNMNAVVRDGNTVRRTAGAWTPTIHRYLDYLAKAGIDWVPRAVGVEGEREILSFVDGEVPTYPLPEWVWTDAALADAARHLRALHDATVGFDAADAVWQLSAHEPLEVICHNDFAPHNLVFEGGRVVGAIDFDTSSPGPRIGDLAYLATRMVPLSADHSDGSPAEEQSRRRIKLMLDAYGSDATWTEVIRVAIIRLRDLAAFSIAKADELAKPQLRQDAALYERDAIYLERVLSALPPD
jgi:Ser/Thr protein kinase RdoA (MazF antagonist)